MKKKQTTHDELHPHQTAPNKLREAIDSSWQKISPCWPLRNIIAVNPLRGFEQLAFEDALEQGRLWFQQNDIPSDMQKVNAQSIKWLQAFFDDKQATFGMPYRELGFIHAMMRMLPLDKTMNLNERQLSWLLNLPTDAETIISLCLFSLKVSPVDYENLLSLMLTTLPGWASYVEYRHAWADTKDTHHPHTISRDEYLAFRLILTYLLWPTGGKRLLKWHQKKINLLNPPIHYQHIKTREQAYLYKLTQSLKSTHGKAKKNTSAQFIFCIDVRSEPFRQALEKSGNYETYGFAGFFGAPISIQNAVSEELYDSCPVLLKPKYHILSKPKQHKKHRQRYQQSSVIKGTYQSLKYTFTAPFALVDMVGSFSGLLISTKSFLPKTFAKIKRLIRKKIRHKSTYSVDVIPLKERVHYAFSILKSIGLTKHFSPYVFLCGHGACTENNAYATALDCGACAGRQGTPNAIILASILNDSHIRKELHKKGITIPKSTFFIAAKHNTTTDEVILYDRDIGVDKHKELDAINQDLQKARRNNCKTRHKAMPHSANPNKSLRHAFLRSQDWAQLRPEWGLARNAGFIIGPRHLTHNIDLEGRCFLHSYDWQEDQDLSSLTNILSAPVIVAQWINAQYFFSSFDNTAFGAGSKTTQNITGKIGVMQGNASDLMHGLPLESVFKNDTDSYHEALRLSVIVYAPAESIRKIITSQANIRQLVSNGWIHLVCMQPSDHSFLTLDRSLSWVAVN